MSDRRIRRLVGRVRTELARRADPEKAEPMRAYMKSEMPFLGVQTPERRRLCRAAFRGNPLEDHESWSRAILTRWRVAEFREERYAAIELAGYSAYHDYQRMRALPMYEEMVVTGAWWDYVDAISHRLGDILRRSPRGMSRRMLAWARGDDLWKRRSAIICQLAFKRETDPDLLEACIEPSLESREFFLRKGIGWALREYAKTCPRWVVDFVRRRGDRMSALTRREALRILIEDGYIEEST